MVRASTCQACTAARLLVIAVSCTLAISAGMSVTSNKQFASGLDILLNSTVELETLSAKARCRPA